MLIFFSPQSRWRSCCPSRRWRCSRPQHRPRLCSGRSRWLAWRTRRLLMLTVWEWEFPPPRQSVWRRSFRVSLLRSAGPLTTCSSTSEPGSSFSSWESVARRLRDSELSFTALQFLAPSALHWMISSAFLVWSTVKRDFSVTGIVSREINYGWRPWSADEDGLQVCMIGREAFNHKIYSSLL